MLTSFDETYKQRQNVRKKKQKKNDNIIKNEI